MGKVLVTNLKPVVVGFDTVTTSTTAGTYTQLPSHPNVDEVVFSRVPTTSGVPVLAAFSATPSGAQFYVATTAQAVTVVPTGPTRNSNALYLTNESGTSALAVPFMYLTYDSDRAPYPTTSSFTVTNTNAG